MRFFPTVLALCALILLGASSGCADNHAPDAQQAEQLTFSKKAADGTVLVQAYVQRPDVTEYLSQDAGQAVQAYYATVDAAARTWWETELSGFAAEDYAAAKQAGQPFRPYTVEEDFTIVRNDETYLCIQRIGQSNTGGAQEEQTVFCENFYKADGSQVALADLFLPDSSYETVLLSLLEQELDRRVQAGQDFYAEDARVLLGQALTSGRFSLTADTLEFVYPCYTLAPYTAGVQIFDIPLSALSGILRDA